MSKVELMGLVAKWLRWCKRFCANCKLFEREMIYSPYKELKVGCADPRLITASCPLTAD